MKTFKITNTFTNTTTTEEHESIEQAWRSIEKTIAVQASEDIDNNGLEENWQDYYSTEYHAHAAHALNFLHFRRQEYEVVELTETEESIVTGDISTIIYNLEQMDFTPEEILMRLEEALEGYTFELDTENSDTITLKEKN